MRHEMSQSWEEANGEPFNATHFATFVGLIAMGLGAGAFVINSKAALLGVMIELAGLLFGLVLAFKIGEWLLQSTRRSRWLLVRGRLGEMVSRLMLMTANEFAQELILHVSGAGPFPALTETDSPSRTALADELRLLHEQLCAAISELSRATDPSVSDASALSRRVGILLDTILAATTNRIIAIVDDPDRVIPLLDLEAKQTEWRAAANFLQEWALGDKEVWQAAADVLGAVIPVYEAFTF